MATEDEAAKPIPAAEPTKEQREAQDKLAEKLTERIRSSTHPPDDKLTETIRQRLEHLVPELVKKTFAAGMGAVFSTEEGLRRIAREVSLPDVVGYVASSADGAKDKVWEIIARETREFLSNLNLTEEIAKILTTLSFEIKTEIRFIPNSERFGGAEPDVKASVRLKRADKPDDKKDEGDRDSRSRLRFWRRDDGGGGGEGGGGEPGGE
ncbi:MAG: hypothetical protein ACM31C_20510 [Acidobacteriota bacterium]